MNRFINAAAAALVLLAPASRAQTASWSIDPKHTTVAFSIRHMMISNVKGEFGKVSGTVNYDGKNVTGADVQAVIDISSVDTNEKGRDDHLRGPEFFDAAKYPTMTFKSKRIVQDDDGFIMYGDLTLHGVTREVALDVDGLSVPIKDPYGNTRIGTTATTKIKRKDFGISYNKSLDNGGALVGDDVNISLDIELVKQQPQVSSSQ